MIKHYVVIRDNKNNICYFKYEKMEGFTFKPLNKLPYKNGVIIDKMVLFKPELIELVLKRKIRNKLNLYLQLILNSAIDSSDDDDEGRVIAALNDLSRYRQLIINTYRRYLEARYVELLISKIAMLEHELQSKLAYIMYKNEELALEEQEMQEERKRSR